ncbi:MAG: replication-associated recombination protein A [Sulfuriflexus sp.]|nr:replication-associated recombination protein A [Sulfuriflexus sp.]
MMDTRADLFTNDQVDSSRPLADRCRPTDLSNFYGQTHLLAADKPLRIVIESGNLHSMLFWGPPGTGKTTLARMIATNCRAQFLSLSAVLSGVKEIRAAVEQAQQAKGEGRQTVLFVDEVHRFNKSQQDAFLPYVEDGTFIFIGATTENPSFELNNALLSRSRVYVLKQLAVDELVTILERGLNDTEVGLGTTGLMISSEQLNLLAVASDGDARRALNLLDILASLAQAEGGIDDALVSEVIKGGVRRFDKGGEAFYDQISALHKSVRGSAVDAALYWLARMLDGGCEPLYIARRVVRMASEDIGNADPRALAISLDAWETVERLGSPEGELALAQAVGYLAVAPKSNAIYKAFNKVMAEVKQSNSLEVPLHLRNAPTALMDDLDYGKGYRYAHDEPEGYAAGEQYFPDGMEPQQYYQPVRRGLEDKIAAKLERLRQQDRDYLNNKGKESS